MMMPRMAMPRMAPAAAMPSIAPAERPPPPPPPELELSFVSVLLEIEGLPETEELALLALAACRVTEGI